MRLIHDRATPEAAEAALTWVIRLTSGASTPEDHAAFRRWRDESELHAEALIRARALWTHLGTTLPEVEREHTRRTRRWRQLGGLVPLAACLVCALGIGHHYWQVWRFDQVTAAGERRTVTFADGSRAVLGADTALVERFDASHRRIILARGQAFFQIRHEARPFIVEAGAAAVRDLGTAFDVALKGDETRVTVAEGMVEASNGHHQKRLAANQAVDISQTSIGMIHAVNAHTEIAWTSGRLILADKPLEEILERVAPYYSRRIILLNRSAAQKRMSAVIELERVDRWLSALNKAGVVSTTTLPGLLILN